MVKRKKKPARKSNTGRHAGRETGTPIDSGMEHGLFCYIFTLRGRDLLEYVTFRQVCKRWASRFPWRNLMLDMPDIVYKELELLRRLTDANDFLAAKRAEWPRFDYWVGILRKIHVLERLTIAGWFSARKFLQVCTANNVRCFDLQQVVVRKRCAVGGDLPFSCPCINYALHFATGKIN